MHLQLKRSHTEYLSKHVLILKYILQKILTWKPVVHAEGEKKLKMATVAMTTYSILHYDNSRKKLKQKIRTIFPDLAPEQLEDLLPSKIPLFVIRLVTFGGVVVTTYHTEGDPIFFDHASGVCPSSE